MDGTVDGRSHDLVDRHGRPGTGRRGALQADVSVRAGGGETVLDDAEHHERCNEGKHDNSRRRDHADDYTAGLRRTRAGVRLASRSLDHEDAPAAKSAAEKEEEPMNIRDVMTPNPRTVSPDDSIQRAARIMREEDTGAIPVVENGRPVGLLTDRDIVVRAVAEGGQLDRPVRDIATTNIVAVTPDTSTREANELMREHQVRRLPVVEGERLVGMVSLGDLAVKESKESRSGETLERVSEGVKEQERY